MLRTHSTWQPLRNNSGSGTYGPFNCSNKDFCGTNPHLTCQDIADSEEELDFILKTRRRIDREVGNDQKCLHGEKYE